jgi:broad specificity phosphatase PhoE
MVGVDLDVQSLHFGYSSDYIKLFVTFRARVSGLEREMQIVPNFFLTISLYILSGYGELTQLWRKKIDIIKNMNNTFYFLRHGQTKRDKAKPISKWILTDKGEEQAKKLAQENIFNDTDIIFSSTEEKAYQTAKPIADKLNKEITQLKEISELNRDRGGFMKPEAYEESVKYCLENLYSSVHNWETAIHALDRFSKKIEELDKKYENKKILVVGHGFTINLYFAKLLSVLDEVYDRFNTNDYADWGIVENKKVIRDIAK